jgi:F-type H+-transporting ATPase subunit b
MLDINIWNFIWALVNIAILFVVLRLFLFKPINKIMDERTKAIQDDIDSAKRSRDEAEALKIEYKQTLADTKAEAQQILVKAREDASAAKQEMISESEEQARHIIDTANKTIENERKRAMQEAQTRVADLAIAAASKIIGENVDDAKNRRLVDEFLAEEGALNNEGE